VCSSENDSMTRLIGGLFTDSFVPLQIWESPTPSGIREALEVRERYFTHLES